MRIHTYAGAAALTLMFCLTGGPAFSQDPQSGDPAAKGVSKGKNRQPVEVSDSNVPLETLGKVKAIAKPNLQIDLPAAIEDRLGRALAARLEWNGGEGDILPLARETDDGFEDIAVVAEGILHAPALARDETETVWCVWGETSADDTVDLFARPWNEKDGLGARVTIADSSASEAFADAGRDARGRVWVVWQSLRAGEGDIYAKIYDPAARTWSDEIPVCTAPGGDWEPKLAFDDDRDSAWVVFDSSRGGEFNLYLTRVTNAGEVREYPIGHTECFEARASIAAAKDGSGFWIAAERGKPRWGLEARGHENATGINAGKSVLFGKFEKATGQFVEVPLGSAGEAGSPVNLPVVGVGREGHPWVAYRYFKQVLWRVALSSYRLDTGNWSAPRRLENSSYGQDRPFRFLPGGSEGDIRVCWPSDLRETKAHQTAGIYLAGLPAPSSLPPAESGNSSSEKEKETTDAAAVSAPGRSSLDRHHWEVGGKKLGLYWGDFHRHTDVSNCRTGYDGCVMDHFRYAYDMARIDFLGTSDHTDVGKIYHPYEWWHNQRMHDALHSPGRFNTLYVYEREQPWPWGHRNIIFAKRGGPLIYINRVTYRNSPWNAIYPVETKLGAIEPAELWDILFRHQKPVAVISHTGATGMGTDWAKYDRLDDRFENVVEIYQGARVSYEGAGAPQPTVGLRPGQPYTINGDAEASAPDPIMDFGKFSAGTYQNALELGHKLGVFASSDHIAQHTSYGGVYCEHFTREGIIAAIDQRRTVAATDRISLDFSCNGQPLGSILESAGQPLLWFNVGGTAKLKRVTIVRNETDWKDFTEFTGPNFEASVTDEAMAPGENRYYVRVVQEDGNMAWSSPVWVTPATAKVP